MPSIEFVPARFADSESLADLRLRAMRPSLERVGRFDIGRARERLLAGFDPACTTIIIVAGTRAGFYVVKPAEDGLLLEHLYIDPGFQGRGIGSEVLRCIFQFCDRGRKMLRVGALRGSDSNRFYLRHGFRKVAEAEFDIYYCRAPRS